MISLSRCTDIKENFRTGQWASPNPDFIFLLPVIKSSKLLVLFCHAIFKFFILSSYVSSKLRRKRGSPQSGNNYFFCFVLKLESIPRFHTFQGESCVFWLIQKRHRFIDFQASEPNWPVWKGKNRKGFEPVFGSVRFGSKIWKKIILIWLFSLTQNPFFWFFYWSLSLFLGFY